MDAGLIKLVIVLLLVAIGWVWGRKNERRHLQELAEREGAARDILLFSTRYPPLDQGPLDTYLVAGEAVVAADHFKMFVAGLRKIVGGRFDAYELLIERARREALLRLKEEARTAGCTLVFNVRVETIPLTVDNQGSGTAIQVLAYGTAVSPAKGTVEKSRLHYTTKSWTPAREGTAQFNLMGHAGTRWTTLGLLALMIWGTVELVLGHYWYVDSAPWGAFLLVALLGALAIGWGLQRHQVPRGTVIGFCLLLLAVTPFLFYMPALRLNALSDPSPTTEYLYRLEADLTLTPPSPELPVLHFPEWRDYFEAQDVGSHQPFILRRGLFRFWQLDRQPVAQRLRAYYGDH